MVTSLLSYHLNLMFGVKYWKRCQETVNGLKKKLFTNLNLSHWCVNKCITHEYLNTAFICCVVTLAGHWSLCAIEMNCVTLITIDSIVMECGLFPMSIRFRINFEWKTKLFPMLSCPLMIEYIPPLSISNDFVSIVTMTVSHHWNKNQKDFRTFLH